MSAAVESGRWLVTGAAGFLGSHLVDELLGMGAEVLALDNLAWGAPHNVNRHVGNQSFQFVQSDIRDQAALAQVMKRFRPQCVAHLAALHYIPAAVADPVSTVGINVYGTQVLLSAALACAVDRIWFASTGDIYPSSDLPHREDDPPGPFDIYGLTKLQGEQLMALAARTHPEKHIVAGRLFNLYGPRETNPHVLPEILRQIVQCPGSPLRLGNLWPTRDLTPVRDAARAIVATVAHSDPGLTIVNIGTGRAWSISEVLEQLRVITGKELPVELDPSRVRRVERPHLQADVRRLRTMIGWTPHSDLARGLAELLQAHNSGAF